MKGGDWIWILVVAFGLIRLLMVARKKKAGESGTSPGSQPVRGPVSARPQADPLKSFIDSLSDRFGQNSIPIDGIPPPQPEEYGPPPPRQKPARARKPRTETAPPHTITIPPVQSEIYPPEQEIGTRLNFSRNPIIQGIIFSEIIGPPGGLGGRNRLPYNSEIR